MLLSIETACLNDFQNSNDDAWPTSELPCRVVSDRLDSPLELFAQRLGEELLDRHIKLGREDDRKTGINVVL